MSVFNILPGFTDLTANKKKRMEEPKQSHLAIYFLNRQLLKTKLLAR